MKRARGKARGKETNRERLALRMLLAMCDDAWHFPHRHMRQAGTTHQVEPIQCLPHNALAKQRGRRNDAFAAATRFHM